MDPARILVERDIQVETRDGTLLATDVYRRADGEPQPVLIQRTPYGKSNARLVGDLMFNPLVAVERGYVVIVQDARGRYGSQGRHEPYVHEAADGYDTVEWAAGQPWSNGRIGLFGSSFVGLLALHGAISAPPHLGAVLVCFTGANLHSGWAYSGGAFELGFSLRLARVLAGDALARSSLDQVARAAAEADLARLLVNPDEAVATLPLDGLAPFTDTDLAFWQDWVRHPAYDEYWRSVDLLQRLDALRVPLLHVTGWYDLFLRGHLDMYARLRDHPDPRVRSTNRFVIGPWDHSAYMSLRPSASGDMEFGPDAISGSALVAPLAFDWFDRWLKDGEDQQAASPVRYFDVGTSRWHETEQWPPSGTQQRLYLCSGGHANTRFGDGTLAPEPADDRSPDHFTYDPSRPVPTSGGRVMQLEFGPGGIQDQRAVEDRPDVLVYTSDVLGETLSLAGPVSVHLTASTDAEDTDFTAKLVDVAMDGYCAIVAEGIARLRYQRSTSVAEFRPANEVRDITIDLWDTAYTFAIGHRIRVEVSSSNHPRFDRNLNVRVTPALGRRADMRVANQTVWHDRSRPSYVALSIPTAEESRP